MISLLILVLPCPICFVNAVGCACLSDTNRHKEIRAAVSNPCLLKISEFCQNDSAVNPEHSLLLELVEAAFCVGGL